MDTGGFQVTATVLSIPRICVAAADVDIIRHTGEEEEFFNPGLSCRGLGPQSIGPS
jgi:hypothetical protein